MHSAFLRGDSAQDKTGECVHSPAKSWYAGPCVLNMVDFSKQPCFCLNNAHLTEIRLDVSNE